MQLVVPIDDSSSGSATRSNQCLRQHHPQREAENLTATGAVGGNVNNDYAILSDDLRDQFETMKSIWRQARRGNDGNSSSNTTMIRKDLKRKERDTALETAIKVDNEISQWRGGIADLEALLAAEEESESSFVQDNAEEEVAVENNGPPGIREIAFIARNNMNNNRQQRIHPPVQLRFPLLPPVIPVVEDEYEEDE